MKTVVVGAGAAGLWCALHAVERGPVVIVAPDPSSGSATSMAMGGIAAAIAEGDDPAAHARDTIAAGAGLCDPRAVEVLTSEAPLAIQELRTRGMVFDEEGAPTLEGGHTARRVLHAGGDATGRVMLEALLTAAQEVDGIEWREARVERLGLSEGRVDRVAVEGGSEIVTDRVVVATGGACGIFGRRTGPERATGHGLWLAFDAGAALADLEFVQFHPTALDVPGHPARLMTEALRGEGAALIDGDGRRCMDRFDPRGELAPRDIVARAIARVRDEAGGPVYLDATGIAGVRERFPTVAASCDEAGLDIATDRIPVAPAAHYFTGGILTDAWGRSSVPGLYACGEAASSGVHGANRLASNSLLEALVFGRRAALAEDAPGPSVVINHEEQIATPSLPLEEVRSLADRFLGVVRNGVDLAGVESKLVGETDPNGDPVATLVAMLVAKAARRREESRGGHFRSDFPEASDSWLRRQAVTRTGWSFVGIADLSDPRFGT
ncbi:MAG TPA: FAD-dependent oxidoreductase [Actinomycetota bacterium]|nr:FAD-dependent oxidoreductase [Actinomycetota bacterium]